MGMEIQQFKELEIFKNFESTFKETSCDSDSGERAYMTESEIPVINFDKVKNYYIRDMGLPETPCSSDALYMSEDNVYFIEFKNGKMSNKEGFMVQKKIYDSLLIFNDLVEQNISFCREYVNFILVYNESKNSKDEITNHFFKKAKQHRVRFNLKKFEKLHFKNVFTYTENEFQQEFLNSLIESA